MTEEYNQKRRERLTQAKTITTTKGSEAMKVENHQVKVISEPNSKGEVKAIFYVKDEQQQRPVSVTLLQPENEEEAIQCAVLARNAIVAIGEELVRVTDELSEVRRRMMAAAGYLSNLA